MTYVALVPFVMTSTKVGTALPLPYFGSFLETNVRLYSIDDAGRHGVLFRSLETARLAVVPVIRIGLGVPYTWARMRMTRDGDHITYHSVRRWPHRGLRSRLTIAVGDVGGTDAAGGLAHRPMGRAHPQWPAGRGGYRTSMDHGPCARPTSSSSSDELVRAGAVQPAGDRLRALFSPGVRTRFGRPCVFMSPRFTDRCIRRR